MLRRVLPLVAIWLLLTVVPSIGPAAAQDQEADTDEETTEPARYGDVDLIETLTGYDLLDEWIERSPVSPEASLLRVDAPAYGAKRQIFLDSLDDWAAQTERLRTTLDRIDAAQAGVDEVRNAIVSVRDSLATDDRLRGPNSKTLVVITAALERIAAPETSEPVTGLPDDPLAHAELLLPDLRVRADAELVPLNRAEAAVNQSGVRSFFGFDMLADDLDRVDELLDRARELVRPEQERADRLVTSTLDLIPELHAVRMLGASDVDGLSVVTVDAYIRAAAGVSCAVDWALLAGIGSIESNHGRLGGASVSRSGQVAPEIVGPLLDGGATQLAAERPERLIRSWWNSARLRVAGEWAKDPRGIRSGSAPQAPGNGFAVVVDSDGGLLDGNDEWDRAIGPMQFLPETWSRWATDGNGDGVSDPHNLYDATAGAARFLCHLIDTRGPTPSNYLLGYNYSGSYVRTVLATAAELRSVSFPTD